MKKKIVSLVILVLILSVCVLSCFVGCSGKNDISHWMSFIEDDVLLKNLVIPGSHDTGTYDLGKLAQTQQRDMAGQLACGTRYFDLRYDIVDGELVMYHGFHGGGYIYKIMYDDNALTVFSQIKSFLQANPTETLILDITNFYDEAKPLLFSTVCEYFRDMAIVNDTDKSDVDFVDTLTLGECRGKCLILWGANNDEYLQENFIFKRNDDEGSRPNSVLHSFYKSEYNGKYTSAKYIRDAIPIYIEQYRQVGTGLFVLQGQLTDGTAIRGPRAREIEHYAAMNEYVASLANSDTLSDINIIMRDFVGYAKNAYAIKLNLTKGYVKEEYVSQFEKMVESNIKKADEDSTSKS